MCCVTPKISCTTTMPPFGLPAGFARYAPMQCVPAVLRLVRSPMAVLLGVQSHQRTTTTRRRGTARMARSSFAVPDCMPAPNPKIGFVSLGCPKALVDSERILTQLKAEGYGIVPRYDKANAVIVNTCGFIDAAVQESLDAIGEALHENGKVIVTGCLGKRSELIREAYPEVLSISGPQDYASVMHAVHQALPKPRSEEHTSELQSPLNVVFRFLL